MERAQLQDMRIKLTDYELVLSCAVKSVIINTAHIKVGVYLFSCLKSVLVFTDLFRPFAPVMRKQRRVESKNLPLGKRSSVDLLFPEPALCCGRSSWQLSSSQQERKWLSGAVLNSPSTGRKSSINEAVSRIGHAVRAHQSSHPLIRQQYFQHPFTGTKQRQGNWAELRL